jgi:small ligand-binding sensory domain FIST
VGGVCDTIAGNRFESDSECSVSMILLRDIGGFATVVPMECIQTPDGWSVLGWDEECHSAAADCGGLLVFACPYTFDGNLLFRSIDALAPLGACRLPVFGGNFSRSHSNSPVLLFAGGTSQRGGAVGLILPRGFHWSTIVSQGCRPIGEPMVITEMQGRDILGLGGKPALEQLGTMIQSLPNRDQALVAQLLLLGRAISEYSETFSHGDFLIRNVVGIDQERQAIRVSDTFRVGQTVRFHLLDPEAADADLRHLAARAKRQGVSPVAGVMISCNGRGRRMFGEDSAEPNVLEHYFPNMPLAGFYAAGEFGPVAGSNFVHGFTAVVALLEFENTKLEGDQRT